MRFYEHGFVDSRESVYANSALKAFVPSRRIYIIRLVERPVQVMEWSDRYYIRCWRQCGGRFFEFVVFIMRNVGKCDERIG